MAKILLVDDERKLAVVLSGELEDRDHQVVVAQDGMAATRLVRGDTFDVVITDIRMEPVDGLELLKNVKEHSPETGVIMMTAYASTETAIDALQQGAADYLIKPFPAEELVLAVDRVLERQRLTLENRELKRQLTPPSGEMIAVSPQMKQIESIVQRVAATDTTVLVTGASGTGKEVIARSLHSSSGRAEGPLVAVNCAALPEPLLESELFGHERGSFTGADRRKLGRFEIADGGTLFLDEIGEIGGSVQAKLLRVLETRSFERVGGTTSINTNVRIIVATNKDLQQEVDEGRFREDLFYRINVFPIELPPLVQRPDDVEALAKHFVASTEFTLSRESIDALRVYNWPGNVRELRNVLERASILCDGATIEVEHLMLGPTRRRESSGSLGDDLNIERLEKLLIATALERTHGNKTEAAKLLGISRRALYSRSESLGIELQ
jgi:DNA-binding NtrC family response regulator